MAFGKDKPIPRSAPMAYDKPTLHIVIYLGPASLRKSTTYIAQI